MKLSVVFSLFAGAAAAENANGVNKVIGLLRDMEAKLKAEGEEMANLQAERDTNCANQKEELTDSIRANTDKQEQASAAVEENAGAIAALEAQMTDLGARTAQNEADLKAAEKVRADENANHNADVKGLDKAIDQLARAISILQRGGAKHTPGNFAQIAEGLSALVQASAIGEEDRAQLKAFVQAHESEDEMGAPEGEAYTNQSGGILDLLRQIKRKAEKERQDLQRAELESRQKFELLKQSLEDQIRVDKNNFAKAKALVGEKGAAKGAAEGDLADATKQLSQDKETLTTVTQDCATGVQNFNDANKARADELAVVAKAIDILSNYNGFIQMTDDNDSEEARDQVAQLLQAASDKFHSQAFAQLASRARVGDPFAKVKGLIEKMINKLQQQALEEADKKAYCDKEKATGEAAKAKHERRLSLLNTRADKYSATIAQTKADMTQLSTEITEITVAVKDTTATRNDAEKAFNDLKEDHEHQIDVIQNAIQVLSDYYNAEGASEGRSQGDSASGVIGFLQQIQSELEQALQTATANENSDKASTKALLNDFEVQLASKKASLKMAESKLKTTQQAAQVNGGEVGETSEQLNNVVEGLAATREQCVHQPMSFEERAAKRQQEIDSLRQALELLTPDSFIQKKVTLHQA